MRTMHLLDLLVATVEWTKRSVVLFTDDLCTSELFLLCWTCELKRGPTLVSATLVFTVPFLRCQYSQSSPPITRTILLRYDTVLSSSVMIRTSFTSFYVSPLSFSFLLLSLFSCIVPAFQVLSFLLVDVFRSLLSLLLRYFSSSL